MSENLTPSVSSDSELKVLLWNCVHAVPGAARANDKALYEYIDALIAEARAEGAGQAPRPPVDNQSLDAVPASQYRAALNEIGKLCNTSRTYTRRMQNINEIVMTAQGLTANQRHEQHLEIMNRIGDKPLRDAYLARKSRRKDKLDAAATGQVDSAVQASVQPQATTALQVLSFEPGTQSAESPIVEQLQRWAQELGYLMVKQPKRRLASAEVGVTEWQCCGTYSPCRGECACPVEPD